MLHSQLLSHVNAMRIKNARIHHIQVPHLNASANVA